MNILYSYAYLKAMPVELMAKNQSRINILFDSGAFTAFKLGKAISLDEYCTFLKNPPFRIWRYFALDVIGNPRGTDRNLQVMLDRGLNPIPVFQRGQPMDKLYELLERFDLVGIGGVAGTNDRNAYLKWILEREDIDKKKLHLLGVAQIDIIRHYKPYSFDSSVIVDSCRFGRVAYFDPIRNCLSKIGRDEVFKNKHLLAALADYPEVVEGLMTPEGWIHSTKSPANNMHFRASAISMLALQKKMTEAGIKFFIIIPYHKDVLNQLLEVMR